MMKAKAIPLSTKGRTARRPTELLVGGKGVLASGFGPGVTAAATNGTLYCVHLRAHLKA